MYPKVFVDYAADRAAFGDVSTLPTTVFFYGMQPGQEINIDLERGKTLIVRYVTTSDAHEDGTRTVFFELNGQPRPIRVWTAARWRNGRRREGRSGESESRGSSDAGHDWQGARARRPDARSRRRAADAGGDEDGDRGRAERDGKIKEILVRPGCRSTRRIYWSSSIEPRCRSGTMTSKPSRAAGDVHLATEATVVARLPRRSSMPCSISSGGSSFANHRRSTYT